MSRAILAALGAFVVLFSGVPARADVETYRFDKAHTQILFFIDHLGFSKSQGEFHDYDGEIRIDRENPANSSVDVTIRTDSIDMDDEKWDAHMKNEDFFDVAQYPEMAFRSTSVNVTGENTAEVAGELTLLGVTKPVTLNVTHNKSGEHPFSGAYVAGFSADTAIRRSEWGMTYGLPGVGDEVHIRLEVEALRQD
ncbi:MAG: polyisoprenoid-binding protein [Alphaproteobacteria bacterium]|nr:polyisoprenoid-binding protein [Alphaproteobacteria bacterium]